MLYTVLKISSTPLKGRFSLKCVYPKRPCGQAYLVLDRFIKALRLSSSRQIVCQHP
jgi:hypothetical protein